MAGAPSHGPGLKGETSCSARLQCSAGAKEKAAYGALSGRVVESEAEGNRGVGLSSTLAMERPQREVFRVPPPSSGRSWPQSCSSRRRAARGSRCPPLPPVRPGQRSPPVHRVDDGSAHGRCLPNHPGRRPRGGLLPPQDQRGEDAIRSPQGPQTASVQSGLQDHETRPTNPPRSSGLTHKGAIRSCPPGRSQGNGLRRPDRTTRRQPSRTSVSGRAATTGNPLRVSMSGVFGSK